MPAVAGSFVVSVLVFREIYNDDHTLSQTISTWIESGSFSTSIGLYADQLTAVMLVMVTFVSLLVHIYSIGYMKGRSLVLSLLRLAAVVRFCHDRARHG